MSRTYKAVTRKERKEGTKDCRSCYRPEIPYRRSPISVSDALRLVEEIPYSKLQGCYDPNTYLPIDLDFWNYKEEEFEQRSSLLGLVFYPTNHGTLLALEEDEFDVSRYSRTNHPVQSVPKIDWHTERKWRNGQKNRNRITTREARDLRARSETVNGRIDSALANGKNPFRPERNYRHSRYG